MTEIIDDEQKIKVGYQVAVQLAIQQWTLVWSIIYSFVTANVVNITLIGLLIERNSSASAALPTAEFVLEEIGITLCLFWFWIIQRQYAFANYFEDCAVFYEASLGPVRIITNLRKEFREDRVPHQEHPLPYGNGFARIARVRAVIYGLISIFGFMYVILFGLSNFR